MLSRHLAVAPTFASRSNRLRRILLAAAISLGLASAAQADPPVLSPTLFLPGDGQIGAAPGDQNSPEIARGGDQYLAVWVDLRTTLATTYSFSAGPFYELDLGSMWDIYAARLDADGQVIDTTPIPVGQQTFNQTMPAVAWNGENWLVVWSGQAIADPYGNRRVNIYAARVSPSGELLDDPPIVIDLAQTMDPLLTPEVASDGTNWFVIWRDLDVQAGIFTVEGTRVGPDGAILDPGGVYIRHASYNSYPSAPYVEFLQDRYLVTFNEGVYVQGQFVQPDLQLIGQPFRVSALGRESEGGSITHDGSQFFVVYSDQTYPGYDQVWGALVQLTGQVNSSIQVTSPSGFGCYKPVAAFDGTNFIVTYERGLTPPVTLRAAIVTTGGQVLQNEIPVATGARHSDFSAIAGRPDGGAVVVWQDNRHDPSAISGHRDILGTTIDAAGTAGEIGAVALGAPRQTSGDFIAYDAGFLAVYRSERAEGVRIAAQRLGPDGLAVDGEPIVVVEGPYSILNPAGAWDGSVFLVVWEQDNAIWGKRLATDGTLLDTDPIRILDGNWPDVAGRAGMFLAVSSHEPINHIRYPMAMRVQGSDGSLVGSPIQMGGSYAEFPRVAALSDRWVAAWHRRPTHDNPSRTVYGNIVDGNGGLHGTMNVSISTGWLPDVAAAADTAIIVYSISGGGQLDDAAYRRVGPTGMIDGGSRILSNASGRQRDVAAGWDGTQFLTCWVDERADALYEQPRGDLFGARVEASGTVLDPDGFAVANDTIPETRPFASGREGLGIVGGSIFRANAPFAALRIGYRILGQDPSSVEEITDETQGDGGAGSVGLDPLAVQVFPNPMTSAATVRLRLPAAQAVHIGIFDIRGAEVRSLEAGVVPAGEAILRWDGTDRGGRRVAPGVYFLRAEIGGRDSVAKITLR